MKKHNKTGTESYIQRTNRWLPVGGVRGNSEGTILSTLQDYVNLQRLYKVHLVVISMML